MRASLAILAFAAGILLLQSQAALPDPAVMLACAISGFGGLILASRHTAPWGARALASCACLFLGFAWAAWRAECRLTDRLPEEWEVRDIRLVGVVAALPQGFERGERFAFDVESVETPGARVPGRILLSHYRAQRNSGEADEAGRVRPGERWRFTVRLKRPHGNANPHGFDYEAWLLERGIRATGTVRGREEMAQIETFVWRPAYVIERIRFALRERFLANLPGAPYAGVLIALAIGDQRAIPGAQWEMFRRTGITHLVSISGLHVTMLAALCAMLVNALWRLSSSLMLRLPAKKAAVAAGWLAALAYTALAGFEVPAQRTLYMLSAVALALWSGRNFGAARTLLLALLVVLILDPWAVLAVGFWLSFGAVAVLFFVSSARVGEVPGETPSVHRWYAGLRLWGVAQWAVTIGGLPLLLLFFQQFSLVSPLANAVAIPVVSFLVTPLALLHALFPWSPLISLDHWLLARLMDWLGWLAVWPVWRSRRRRFGLCPWPCWGSPGYCCRAVFRRAGRSACVCWYPWWRRRRRGHPTAKRGSTYSTWDRGWPSRCARRNTRCSTILARASARSTPGSASSRPSCAPSAWRNWTRSSCRIAIRIMRADWKPSGRTGRSCAF
jgi:competence protein ComEC